MLLNYLSSKDYKVMHYKKEKIIFKEGEECFYIGIVLKGNIVIQTYTADGKEIIFNNIHENEVFGNNLIFSSKNRYKGNVIALVDSDVALIEKNKLYKLLQENSKLFFEFMALCSDNVKELNNRIKILSFNNISDRFMCYLHMSHNEIKYTSITNLANYLNVSREALSRLIHSLEKNKIINIKNKTIIKRP